ncbi:helix-turn-helix transcriptional regulator [Lentilactobacillus sp. TOM.63]|uniref:helix-turn-helix domain-containing protein n=1 Tax=Lentilactobacillus sp. TOM.63 TaxID=3055077 RepID=UPI0025A04A14|nr:helix-turn-helix transcriptional regulator [Lentilactobacillus sp. TOM.63]MDM7517293.1 helix-turn-helix transcriptional regulator [Lentilactobacillus sp. TOM.63]
MASIGETVKKIRNIKGFTQKEVYSGIVSRSFANRFERGLNDVSASKLFAILDNLSISVDEFRFIQNDYHQTATQELDNRLRKAYDAHNLQIMGKIVADHKESPNLGLRSLAATGEILIECYYSKTITVTPEIDNLWNKLFSSKTWTIQEIKFADILFVIAISKGKAELIPEIFDQFEKNCKQYISLENDPFDMSTELMNMYLTVFQIQLNLTEYDRARKLIDRVMVIDPHTLSADGRIMQQLINGVWQLYFGDETKGDQILKAIEQFEGLYSPPIDHNAMGIIEIRRKLAKQYRKELGKQATD